MGLDRVDSDQVARRVVEPGSPGLLRVVERFGEEVLTADGELDRPALGRIVFASERARRDLEAILHPLIWESLGRSLREAHERRRETVFEIPLLYEKGSQTRFSTVWVVAASPQVQRRRLTERDGLSSSEAQARLEAQMKVEEKVKRADFVLVNDGDLDQLKPRVEEGLSLWRRARSVSSREPS